MLLTANEGKDVVDLSNPHNLAEMDRIVAELRSHPDLIEAVVTPGNALEWSDNLIQKDARRRRSPPIPPSSVAGKALLTALTANQPDGQPQSQASKDARLADSTHDALPARRHPARASGRSTTRTGVEFLIYDNQDGIRKPLSAVYTDTTHAQIVVRLVGNASIETEGAGAVLVQNTIKDANFENATVTVTGAAVLLKQINDYLKGGMLTLGAIAVVVMTIILLLLFNVRWRLLPAVRDPHRRDLGVRPGRLPRHPAVAGDHRRPAGDARHRHRLRDPDARARRGRSDHRPRRAPDPGDGAQPRARRCWSSPSTPSSPSWRCASPRCR